MVCYEMNNIMERFATLVILFKYNQTKNNIQVFIDISSSCENILNVLCYYCNNINDDGLLYVINWCKHVQKYRIFLSSLTFLQIRPTDDEVFASNIWRITWQMIQHHFLSTLMWRKWEWPLSNFVAIISHAK